MRHSISTIFGNSSMAYGGGKSTTPVHVICQGNRAGPSVWNVISSPILETLRKQNCDVKLKTISKEEFCRRVFSFVDETDLGAADEKFQSTTELINSLQKSIDVSQGSIQATGGELVP